MELQAILDTIKSESLTLIKDEFKELINNAKNDKSEFIQKSAEQLKQALSDLAEGKLSKDDVTTLLKKQQKIAEIEANNAEIELRARIQKIIYRILDISLNTMIKEIKPA